MVTRYDVESDPQDGPCSLWPVEDEQGPYVTYEDYAALETRLLAILDHPVMKAHTDALREAQITGLAFIRVNANGHVQALPSDRVRISVIQAVEERTAAWVHDELQIGEVAEKSCDHPRRVIWEHGNRICEACDICHTVRIRAIK